MMQTRLLLAAVAVFGFASAPLRGQDQPGRKFQFSEPDKFFQQFLGRQNEQKQAAFARVEVTAAEELQYGDRASRTFVQNLKRRSLRVTSRGKHVDYVKQLAQLIRPQMQNHSRYRRLSVYLVESDETDAFAFPGGTFFLFRGMLEFAQNEAALVGVIGHELSHIDRGHQLADLRRMKLAQQTFSNRSEISPENFFQSGMLMMRSFMRPFRPEDETEADADGATWAYRAGYDPRELAALFVRLSERDGNRRDNTPAFFRTHPFHAERYAAIMALYEKRQASEPRNDLYKGAQNLRRRVTRIEREFPE